MKDSSIMKLIGFVVIIVGFVSCSALGEGGSPIMRDGLNMFVGFLGFVFGLGLFMLGRRVEKDKKEAQ